MITDRRVRISRIVRLLILSCAVASFLPAQPSLRITSPSDRTIVRPGESLTVTVEVSSAIGAFQGVLVLSPLGNSGEMKTSPYRFTLQIKNDVRPNNYPITAMGWITPGQLLMSDPITVLVERADSPVRLRVLPTDLSGLGLDEKPNLEVTGEFADGTRTDLTQSSRVRYVSTSPAVATVDSVGRVTPVGPGSAWVIVGYGDLKAEIPVSVIGGRQ